MRISKGDKVKIIDIGCIYDTYKDMAELMCLPHWRHGVPGGDEQFEGKIFTVLITKKHPDQKIILYGIDNGVNSVIIEKLGIELIEGTNLPDDLFEI